MKPSERPELTMRLSRLRHEDVQPRAQLAHGGSIPRGRQGMQGSMTTRVPMATEQFGPASTTRPAVSWPRTNGNVPMEARVGDGPVLCANRCRSLPQIPPVVTWTRAQDGPGRSGSGTSLSEAGKAGSTMSNTTARHTASVKRARIGICAPPFSGVRLRVATPAPSRFLLLCPH